MLYDYTPKQKIGLLIEMIAAVVFFFAVMPMLLAGIKVIGGQ